MLHSFKSSSRVAATLFACACGMTAWAQKPAKPEACRLDREVYAATDTVAAVVSPVAGAAQVLWLDSDDRILKTFPPDRAIACKLDCPTTRFNRLAAVDRDGKILAETGFVVTPDIAYWDDYEVWMYGGATEPHAPDYEHERACNMNGTELAYNWTRPEGAARNNLRWYREWCVPKFKIHYEDRFRKGYWAAFMTAFRAGELDTPEAERKYLMRPDCLSDPAFIESCKSWMREATAEDARYRSGAYSISDEPSVTSYSDAFDYCFDPHTMQAMRLWLREKYGSLEALNAEWATAFKTWDEVFPLTTNEARSRENPHYKDLLHTKIGGTQIRERCLLADEYAAPGRENYAAWSDHREFMDTAYANLLAECTKVVRETDPHAPAGILGTQGPSAFGGWDYWKLVHAVDWFEPYEAGNSWEIVTSWRQPRTVVSQTLFISQPGAQRYHASSYFLKGSRGSIVYEPGMVFKQGQIVNPVLAALRLTWGELRGGLGKLRYRLEDVPPSVGVYYNQASRRVSWLFDSEADGTTWPRRFSSWDAERASMNKGIGAVLRAVQDNGCQVRMVAEQQAVDGDLLRRHDKVLFLARIEALSEAEARALRAFVEAGGILVTDGGLGTLDPQCRRRDKGLLDDLCGVRHADFRFCERDGGCFAYGHDALVKTAAAGSDPLGAALLKDVDLARLFVSAPGLRANGGTPLAMAGETPALIVNRVKQGLVICANVYWADYAENRGNPALGAPILNLVRNILDYAAVKPPCEIYEREGASARASGRTPPMLQRYAWQDGELRYLAFNVHGKIAQAADGSISISGVEAGMLQPLSVKLPHAAHVYNARTGVYYGKTDLVPVDLDTYSFVWLSLLPYEVRDVRATREAFDARDPWLVRYAAAVRPVSGAAGTHVLHLDVIAPDGTVCDALARNLVAEQGRATGALRLARNGQPGAWTLRFRDAATGVIGELKVQKDDAAQLAAALPVQNAIQNGRLFGRIAGPVSLRQENDSLVAAMQVMVWSEGVQNPRGKVTLRVNSPWRLQQTEYDLAEQIAKLQGEFQAQVLCPAGTDLAKTPLTLTARVSCGDGRALEIKGATVSGAALVAKLAKKTPLSLEFSSYYEDMNRLTIRQGVLTHTLPFTIRCDSLQDLPRGKVTFAVTPGWSVQPQELDLTETVVRRRGEGLLTVTGPAVFSEEPVVTMTVTLPDGDKQEISQHVAMTYARYTAQAPTLDGRLDDACWKQARAVTTFHPEGSSETAPYPTSFRVCYDDKNVYVAIEVHGLDPAKMKVLPPTPGATDEDLWGQEFMEVFFDPTQRAGKVPYQLGMNVLGRRTDMIGEDQRWNGTWDVKGARTADGYALELAVPFETLHATKPKPNDIWAFNVYRNTFAPFAEFHGCWSVVGDSRASSFFGRLYFLAE
jgi:hypothetical protein